MSRPSIAEARPCSATMLDKLEWDDLVALRKLFEYQFTVQWEHDDEPGSPNFNRRADDSYANREVSRAWVGFQLAWDSARAFADRHAEAQEEIVTTDIDKITKVMARGDHQEAAQRALAVFGKLQVGNGRNTLVSTGELAYYVKRHGGVLPAPRRFRGEPQVSIRGLAH